MKFLTEAEMTGPKSDKPLVGKTGMMFLTKAQMDDPNLVLDASKSIDKELDDLEKAGPYIGPRGGKWADAKHTIPWKEGEQRKTVSDKSNKSKIKDDRMDTEVAENQAYDISASLTNPGSFLYIKEFPGLDQLGGNKIVADAIIYTLRAKGKRDTSPAYGQLIAMLRYKVVTKKEILNAVRKHLKLPIVKSHSGLTATEDYLEKAFPNEHAARPTKDREKIKKSYEVTAMDQYLMKSYRGSEDWINKFMGLDDLYVAALKCYKKRLEVQKKRNDSYGKEKSWDDRRKLSRVERAKYEDKMEKDRKAVNKEFDRVQDKEKELESKLIDAKIKRVEAEQASAGKGMYRSEDTSQDDLSKSAAESTDTDDPQDVEEPEQPVSAMDSYLEKAGVKINKLPSGDKRKLGEGPEEGWPAFDLPKLGIATGPHDAKAAEMVNPPAPKRVKLSVDDEWEENQMKAKPKPLESMRRGYTNGAPDTNIQRASAQVQRQLEKSEQVQVGIGVSTPESEKENLSKANHWKQGDVHYSNQSDLDADRLLKSDSDFYNGAPPSMNPQKNALEKSELCKCGSNYPIALNRCPGCGTLAKSGPSARQAPVVTLRRNGPALRPRIQEQIHLPGK